MNYKLQIRRRRYCVRVVKITETPTHIPTLKVPGKQQTKFVQGQSNRKRREKHQRNIFLVEAKKRSQLLMRPDQMRSPLTHEYTQKKVYRSQQHSLCSHEKLCVNVSAGLLWY